VEEATEEIMKSETEERGDEETHEVEQEQDDFEWARRGQTSIPVRSTIKHASMVLETFRTVRVAIKLLNTDVDPEFIEMHHEIYRAFLPHWKNKPQKKKHHNNKKKHNKKHKGKQIKIKNLMKIPLVFWNGPPSLSISSIVIVTHYLKHQTTQETLPCSSLCPSSDVNYIQKSNMHILQILNMRKKKHQHQHHNPQLQLWLHLKNLWLETLVACGFCGTSRDGDKE